MPLTNIPKTSADGFKILIHYLQTFFHFAGWKAWISIALMVALGFTQGAGLLLLLPFLRVIGLGDSGVSEGPIIPWIEKFFINTGIPLNLPVVLLLYILIVATQAIATRYQQVLNAELVNGFTLFLRDRFNRVLTYSRWLTFIRLKAADITHVLTSEISRVAGVTSQMLTLPGTIVVACVHLAVAFAISPLMTLAALACGGFLLLIMRPFNIRVQQSGQALRDSTRSMYSSVMDFMAGMKVAKSYGLEDTHLTIFQRNSTDIARQLIGYTRTISLTGMYFQIGTAVAIGAFLWAAVELAQLAAERMLVIVFIFSRQMRILESIAFGHFHAGHKLHYGAVHRAGRISECLAGLLHPDVEGAHHYKQKAAADKGCQGHQRRYAESYRKVHASDQNRAGQGQKSTGNAGHASDLRGQYVGDIGGFEPDKGQPPGIGQNPVKPVA